MKNIFQSGLFIAILVLSSFQSTSLTAANEHEYTTLTKERIDIALKAGASKDDILLAEGSLTALGWFVLYGNDETSFNLAEQLAQISFDKYNGTDLIFIRQLNQAYGEMLNLNRFDSNYPAMISSEYAAIVKERVEAAYKTGAGYSEFKLAEGSLCALGWMTAYGKDAASMEKADKLMNLAYKTWSNSDGYYMMQSSEAYAEIINLGRFAIDEKAATLTEHQYTTLTKERVETAITKGSKEEILLAEGSLTALGWFVLYGNDNNSFNLVDQLDKITFDKYNGTEMIHIRQLNQSYFEMLNLNRFENRKPKMVSSEYAAIVKERVEAAYQSGAGYSEFKLAEGSLCALGWMTAYGIDAVAMQKADKLMNLAFGNWRNSDGYYMMQSSEGYGEIINLGRFKID
jgi:dethiobiotin synthetase